MRGYSDFLRDFLRPLGIYDLSPGSLSNSELEALGSGFDGVSQRMDYVERESALSTAEGEGLDRMEALFARTPVHYSVPPAAAGPGRPAAHRRGLLYSDGHQ